MDFILNEADIDTDSLKFDSDEDEMECDNALLSEDEDLLDDDSYYEEDIEQSPSFYRTFDNGEEFLKFGNQLKIQSIRLKGLKNTTMEKMICKSCLLLKKEKMLTFIFFKTIRKRL